MHRLHPAPTRQRGVTLLEALIAFLVLSLGMLAISRAQAGLRLHAEMARQRSEAVRLAQEDIESVRGFAVLAATPGLRAYADIATDTRRIDAGTGYASNTRFQLTRQVDAAGAGAKAIDVSVHWTDRGGAAQQLTLHSLIVAIDPAMTAALGLARSGDPVAGPLGRSIRIPLAARDLGDGRSALKPVSGGNVALLFDNRSGRVVGRCTGVDAAIETRALRLADLLGCDANVGLLLDGVVRFSSAAPADAAQANDAPLALNVVVALDTAPTIAPQCTTETRKTVTSTVAGSLRIDDVALAATPASVGGASWSDRGERSLAYHCVVYPAGGAGWSGRVTLQPIGWQIGSGAGDRRVCRYASDLDGSGAIDANIEHPAHYAGVSVALARQNFLVIAGGQACPAGQPVRIANQPNDVFANLATLPHQP